MFSFLFVKCEKITPQESFLKRLTDKKVVKKLTNKPL